MEPMDYTPAPKKEEDHDVTIEVPTIGVAYVGASAHNQLKSIETCVDILVATPGRLTGMIERSKISLKKIKYLGCR
ncbi:helicase Cas3, CRISPR-associated, core [Artemisia annua]|uniref:Helicase Cas3, CRISPR-associated, core n=1 Tax=Artemisia annua TaxID=35608 RepID=A0A2U1MZ16_ARTAN|nr:helicase Cas3, CRISPR-associated, core [Artemisia annua]